MSALLTYTKFQTPEDAAWLTSLLEKNNIAYTLSHEVNQLDNIYLGESLDPMYELKIEQGDFQKVSDLLSLQAIEDVKQRDFEHYFLQFDELELKEVLSDSIDRNAYDLQVAKSLLTEKFNVTIEDKKSAELAGSYKPEKLDGYWIAIGYLLFPAAIMVRQWVTAGYLSYIMTIFGLIFGLSILQSRKTLQNGEQVHIYDKSTVTQGRNIILVGIITCIYLIMANILNNQ